MRIKELDWQMKWIWVISSPTLPFGTSALSESGQIGFSSLGKKEGDGSDCQCDSCGYESLCNKELFLCWDFVGPIQRPLSVVALGIFFCIGDK
jgi:hypothetical protein